MKGNDLFTEEQLDYLVEMLNIGAGNASTALSHLLQCEVNMKMPGVEVVPPAQAASTLGDPALPVACLRMKMVGDMTGCLFFIVPDDREGETGRTGGTGPAAGPRTNSRTPTKRGASWRRSATSSPASI